MQYHSDRFEDCSCMVLDHRRVVAALPASIDETGKVTSHAGLTFGGLVVGSEVRGNAAIASVDLILEHLRSCGGTELEVRTVPPWFCSYPCQEMEFALWQRGFELSRRDLPSILPLNGELSTRMIKRRNAAKGEKAGLRLGSTSLPAFHLLLSEVLGERHGVAPVHSLAELQLLQSLFPDHILLRTAELDGDVLAGTLIYRYPTAWHTQYLAASQQGREVGALDWVVQHVIDEARTAGAQFLSFGTSTTNDGRELNEGLLFQKEGFGARSIVHDFWSGRLS